MFLSRVNVAFLFWSLFPVFPRIQTVACVFHSQSNFIGSFFLYSPRRPTFSDLFHMRFHWWFWVAVSGILPFSNLFLLIFLISSSFDWLKYLGTLFRLRTNGKYINGWGIFVNSKRERDKSKQMTEQRRKKRRKKGEELKGKGLVLLEGRGTIGCYSEVSVIVGVQSLMH